MYSTARDRKEIRTDTIDGRTFAIYLSSDGSFVAEHDGEDVVAPSLRELHEKLRAIVRRAKARIAVPISLCSGASEGWNSRRNREPNVEDATITGVHASNGNILIKRADGKTEQCSGGESESGVIVRRLTKAERERYLKLATEKRTAVAALDAFMESMRLGVGKSGLTAYIKEHVDKAANEPAHAKGA